MLDICILTSLPESMPAPKTVVQMFRRVRGERIGTVTSCNQSPWVSVIPLGHLDVTEPHHLLLVAKNQQPSWNLANKALQARSE